MMVHFDAFAAILLFVLLGLFFYGPWQSVLTDVARQIMFEKRDAIFDLAAQGRLDFRSDAYRSIRKSLEQSIRFAHDLTLVRAVVLRIGMSRLRHESGVSDQKLAIEAIEDAETRAEVTRLVYQAQRALLWTTLFKSPIICFTLLILAIPALILAMFSSGFREFRRGVVRGAGEVVQREAELAGG